MTTLSQHLINAGSSRTIATTLEALSDGEWKTLRQIERDGDMRQAETSIAVSLLAPYLERKKVKEDKGRGASLVTVRLKKGGLTRYLDHMVCGIEEEHTRRLAAIEKAGGYIV